MHLSTLPSKLVLYLKVFLLFGFAFCLLIIFAEFQAVSKPDIGRIISSSAIFGGLMSFFFTTYHLIQISRAKKDKEGWRNPKHTLVYDSTKEFGSIFETLLAEFEKSHGWKILVINKEAGLIKFLTPINILTWGEVISLRFLKQANGKTKITITSYPLWATTAFDWGRNKRNIRKIEELVKPLGLIN